MADFNITGNMQVGSLKKKFKEQFGSTLRVFVGRSKHYAEDDRTIADITEATVEQGSEVSAHGRTLCKKFEDQVMETFGFGVQVATPDNSALVDNNLSLTESGKIGTPKEEGQPEEQEPRTEDQQAPAPQPRGEYRQEPQPQAPSSNRLVFIGIACIVVVVVIILLVMK